MKQIELQNLSKIVNCTCEHEHEDSHLEKSIKAEGGLYHWNKDKQPIEDIYEKLIDFNQLYEYLLSKIEYKKSIVKAFVFGKPKLLLKADGNPFTNEELELLDGFIEDFFKVSRNNVKYTNIRAFIVGRIIEQGKSLTTKEINEIPNNYEKARKVYHLTQSDINAIKWGELNTANLIKEMSSKTKDKVRDILIESKRSFDSLKYITDNEEQLIRMSNNQIKAKLYNEIRSNSSELNKDWRRIAVTESNTMMNNGAISTNTDYEFMIGVSIQDACQWCKKNIENKIVMKLPYPPPDYTIMNPESKKYEEIAFLWDNCIWTGKDNYNRSTSPRKIVGDKLVLRAHHEKASPASLGHPNCRCTWMKLLVNSSFFDNNGDYQYRTSKNENEYQNWLKKFKEREQNILKIVNKYYGDKK